MAAGGIFSTTIRNTSEVPGLSGDWTVEHAGGTVDRRTMRVSSPDGVVHWLTAETLDGRLVATAGVRGGETAFAVRIAEDGSFLPRIVEIDGGEVHEKRFPDDAHVFPAQRESLFAATCDVDPDAGPVLTVVDMRNRSTVLSVSFEVRGNVLNVLFSEGGTAEPVAAAFCGDGIAVGDPGGRFGALIAPRGVLPLHLAARDVREPESEPAASARLSAAAVDDVAADLEAGAGADVWFDAEGPDDGPASDMIGRTQHAMTEAARSLRELRSLAEDLARTLAAAARIAEEAAGDPPEGTADLLRRAGELLGTDFRTEPTAHSGPRI